MNDLASSIRASRNDASALERLYRAAGRTAEPVFRNTVADLLAESPTELLRAWAYRLDVLQEGDSDDIRIAAVDHWTRAVAVAAIAAVFCFLMGGGRPPVPLPGVAAPAFWIGWGPLTAVAILAWLALRDGERRTRYLKWAGAVAVAGALMAWIALGRTDQGAGLIAVHFPFLCWCAVGAAVVKGRTDTPNQVYAFLVKSAEAILAAGIYLGGGALFLVLTAGIFSALGIRLSERFMQGALTVVVGAIPVLAVATVYNPDAAPVEQDESSGLARVLRILMRLLLPLAHVVLVLYIIWFLPAYFNRPTEEREVLIVYNATLIAIYALLAFIASGSQDIDAHTRQDIAFRYGILATVFLTIVLNAYALAAVLIRTVHYGMTANRHAVIGWNIVTLAMFIYVCSQTWLARQSEWRDVLRRSVAVGLVPAVAWSVWVTWGVPNF